MRATQPNLEVSKFTLLEPNMAYSTRFTVPFSSQIYQIERGCDTAYTYETLDVCFTLSLSYLTYVYAYFPKPFCDTQLMGTVQYNLDINHV